jgi:hypothetical protein
VFGQWAFGICGAKFAVEVVVGGRDGCVVGVVGEGFDYVVVGGVGVGLMMDMVEWGFFSALVGKGYR